MKIYPLGHVIGRFAQLQVRAGCLALVGLGSCAALNAAEVSWQSAVDGDWQAAANWSSNPSLPGLSDTVTIAATSGGTNPYTVTFGSGLTTGATTLALGATGAPSVNLNMTGGTLTLDTGATGAALSMTNASLNVGAGAVLNLWTATEAGTAGITSLAMSGGASVTVGGSLITERAGGGGTNPQAGLNMSAASGTGNTFTVSSGGTTRFGYSTVGTAGNALTGSTNAVVVDGGSLWFRSLTIGTRGEDNTVTVKNGGTLTVGASGFTIGGGTGQSGAGHLIIGDRSGNTVISEGTVVGSAALTLGSRGSGTTGTGGTGTITLNAGSLTTGSVVLGGGASDATTLVTEGTIHVHGGLYSLSNSAARTVTVSGRRNTIGLLNITGGEADFTRTQGDNILTLAPNVTVGDTGTGTLNLSGGTLKVDKFLSETSAGTIHFTGGLFTVKQATVNNGNVFTVGNGTDAATLRFVTGTGSGTHTFADGLVVAANARVEGAGAVGSAATIRGTLAATGAMTFTAGLSLLDGATIDLNGGGTLAVTGGSLVIADGATINASLASFTDGQAVTLFSVAGSTPDLGAVQFTFNGVATTGAWVGDQFQITASAIPEASSFAVWFAGAAFLTATLRRRRA